MSMQWEIRTKERIDSSGCFQTICGVIYLKKEGVTYQ